MPWLFQEGGLTQTWADVDSREIALTSTSSTPLVSSCWGYLQDHGAELLSGCEQLIGKKEVSQNSGHLAVFELQCFDWSAEMELRVAVGGITRQSLALLRALLVSASPDVPLSWHRRGHLLRKKAIVKLGWWHMPQECYPTEGKSSVNKKSNSGICLSVLTAL